MILLRYHHGYSVREIAGMMGISLPAAIKLDQRAKQKLKKLCEEAGSYDQRRNAEKSGC